MHKLRTKFSSLFCDLENKYRRLSKYVDCRETAVFKPIASVIMYQWNLHNDSKVDKRHLYADYPPADGINVGMNIWTG